MRGVSRLRAMIGIAIALLRHERMRTVLAVLGVAMAVLSSVLLVSVGLGVIDTGVERLDQSDRDLWVTGGPIELRPGTVGGFQNSLIGAHEVANEIHQREDVANARAMAFQTVYASRNTSQFKTILAAGAPARGPSVSITRGRPFQQRDAHYAGGTYSGPMTYEAVLDEQAANLLGVSVNDTIHVGGTLASARQHEFRVMGISPTYSRFVGAPTITLHLSELQEITGTTGSDRASFITVRIQDGADIAAVESAIETQFPDYTVRTNREQLTATLENQALVIVSGVSLALLAVVIGVLLVVNLQLSFVFRHRDSFAVLRAVGLSGSSLVGVVGIQTFVLGLLGGIVGVSVSVPGLWGINYVARVVTGFEGVIAVSDVVLAGGFGVAIGVSLLGGLAASVYLVRMRALAVLG